MIDAALLDKLDLIGKAVRGDETKPFGGLQIILCGDFAQLPPVKAKGGFAFEANCWKELVHVRVDLTEIVRQSEVNFRTALNDVRFASLTTNTINLLRTRVNAKVGDEFVRPTRLLSKREDVIKVNDSRLDALESQLVEFQSADTLGKNPVSDQELIEKMNKDMQACQILRLKIGAQVMLIVNLSNELVNGSRGVVTGFKDNHPIVRFLGGTEKQIKRNTWKVKITEGKYYQRLQFPLILAWACTIHKIQGASLDCIDIDISNAFEFGQAYVALSRVRMLDGLRLRNNDLSKIMAHPKIKAFYNKTEKDEAEKDEAEKVKEVTET